MNKKTLSVKIPAGVDTGDRIRLSGQGEAGLQGAPPGDLYVQIVVDPHPLFQRKGRDLCCDVPVSFMLAALGGEIEVPTLSGLVKLKVPPGSQAGKLLRLRGQGIKPAQNRQSVGDLLCRLIIEIPERLTGKQKALLMELDQSIRDDQKRHLPKLHAWLKHFKSSS